MATITAYNSYGIPVGWIQYESAEESRNIDRADRGVFMLAVLVAAVLFMAVSSILPMWQRVFIHPQVTRLHMARAKLSILIGAGALLLYVGGGFCGMHQWRIGWFSALGIALLSAGLLTLALGWIHLKIGEHFPEKVRGNGYGLLNIYCLFTGLNPTHLWTFLQDAAIVGAFIYFVAVEPAQNRVPAFIGCGIMAACILGWTWHAQVTCKDPASIDFN